MMTRTLTPSSTEPSPIPAPPAASVRPGRSHCPASAKAGEREGERWRESDVRHLTHARVCIHPIPTGPPAAGSRRGPWHGIAIAWPRGLPAWHRLAPGLLSGPGRRAATVTLSRHGLSVTVRRAAADGAVPRPRRVRPGPGRSSCRPAAAAASSLRGGDRAVRPVGLGLRIGLTLPGTFRHGLGQSGCST